MEPENSTTFMKRPPSMRDDSIPPTVKNILLNRLFLGQYEERRYVSLMNQYRDVVRVNPVEKELIVDLNEVILILAKNCDVKWVGITGPRFQGAPNGLCLWVKLAKIPFGHFWFQIKQIKHEEGEIILKLKCIRSVRFQEHEVLRTDNTLYLEESLSTKSSFKSNEYMFDFNPAQKFTTMHNNLNYAVRQILPHLTWKNFFLLGKFVFTITFLLLAGILTFVHHLGDYSLRLTRELTLLLNAVMPIAVQAIDCLTKTIGGLFILIASLIKKEPKYPQQRNQFPSIQDKFSLPEIEGPPTSPFSNDHKNTSSLVSPNWRERNRNLKMQLRS